MPLHLNGDLTEMHAFGIFSLPYNLCNKLLHNSCCSMFSDLAFNMKKYKLSFVFCPYWIYFTFSPLDAPLIISLYLKFNNFVRIELVFIDFSYFLPGYKLHFLSTFILKFCLTYAHAFFFFDFYTYYSITFMLLFCLYGLHVYWGIWLHFLCLSANSSQARAS